MPDFLKMQIGFSYIRTKKENRAVAAGAAQKQNPAAAAAGLSF